MICPRCGNHISGNFVTKNGSMYVNWLCKCGYNPAEQTFESAMLESERRLNESLKELELMRLRNAPSNNPIYLC